MKGMHLLAIYLSINLEAASYQVVVFHTYLSRSLLESLMGGHYCRSSIMKQVFRLKCELSADTVEVSILNAQVIQLGRPVLEVDEHSRVLQFPQRKTSDFAKLSELCSGIGGLGQGAKYAGWEIAAQNVSSGGRGSLQARYPDQNV